MRRSNAITHWTGRAGLLASCICFAGALSAQTQYTTANTIVLPPDKAETPVTIVLPEAPAAGTTVAALSVKDASGKLMSPAPAITADPPTGAKVNLHFSNLFFTGAATLPIQVSVGAASTTYTYALQRGPDLYEPKIEAERDTQASFWLYNSGTQPLDMRWRIVSDSETICGVDADGNARTDCSTVANLPDLTIQAGRSGRVPVTMPSQWFDPFRTYGRKAQLELHFGSADTAPVMQYAVVIDLQGNLSDVVPTYASRLPSPLIILGRLIWVTVWVALGAVFLMLTQVMIPNFHKCMAMETQVDRMEESLRGISSAVGNRLNTRCTDELQTLRSGLAMGLRATRKKGIERLLSVQRMGLWGNTAEVTRLAGILQKVQSRIQLTQRLDEAQTAAIETDSCMKPPSLRWTFDKKLNAVRTILSGQFISDADEKNVYAILALLTNPDDLRKEFETDLETRIAGLRRTFLDDPWKTKCTTLIGNLNECAELLKTTPDPAPPGGRTMDELIRRDLGAVKLSFIEQMIILEPLLPPGSPQQRAILNRLTSSDAGVLAEVCNELSKLAQGVSEQDIEHALVNEMWDSFFDYPTPITAQDVVRVSLVFRERRLERSAAKKNFRCYWNIDRREATTAKGNKEGDDLDSTFEEGWNTQLIALRGSVMLWPEINSPTGAPVTIRLSDADGKGKRPPTKDAKGVFSFEVQNQPLSITTARLVRGLLDSMITALVPVVTVALTQANSGADMGIGKLMLLGFTSQAIRAAVIPDPPAAAATPPATTTTTSTPNAGTPVPVQPAPVVPKPPDAAAPGPQEVPGDPPQPAVPPEKSAD